MKIELIFGWEASNVQPPPPASTPPQIWVLLAHSGSIINPSRKMREQRGNSWCWNQSWEQEREAQLQGCPWCSQGSSSSACKLHESHQANPGLGENLFLTWARSGKAKVMSKQIFVAAVLSCVDCGAGGTIPWHQERILPTVGKSNSAPASLGMSFRALVSQKAELPYSTSTFPEGQKAEVWKNIKENFPALSLHEFLVIFWIAAKCPDFPKWDPTPTLLVQEAVIQLLYPIKIAKFKVK